MRGVFWAAHFYFALAPGYGRASYTMLKGVSVARRKRLKPAVDVTTSRMRFSPDLRAQTQPDFLRA